MGPQQRCCGIACSVSSALSSQSLQWGRSSAAAELRGGKGRGREGKGLQWGRSSAAAELRGDQAHVRDHPVASMGPQQRCCGIAPILHPGTAQKACFNGAAAALLRNCQPRTASHRASPSFNGAAAALLRNYKALLRRMIFATASMGPQQRCCGIETDIAEHRVIFPLQWGRSSAAAELRQYRAVMLYFWGLQWGRSSAAAELGRRHRNGRPRTKLQWGRSSAAAELTSVTSLASESPRLQWGRSSAAAELRRTSPSI